jgi:hypothetical protein
MSTSILTSVTTLPRAPTDSGHKRIVTGCAVAAILATVALLVYGLRYYLTAPLNRPYHPRHLMLRSSGTIGWWLGIGGLVLFFLIILYPIRKKWKWLGRIGNSRHWLDYHILMGLTLPVVAAFHATFKFHGIAGMAYWTMFAVSASGIVGRYFYSQIPRSRNDAELSMQESKYLQESLTSRLASQRLVKATDLENVFRLPSAEYVERKSMLLALGTLLWIDLKRPFRTAKVRRHALGAIDNLVTLGGLLPSRNHELELVLLVAREQAGLTKKLLFLSKSQKVFQLWHVVHRPFSYSFAVLLLVHVGTVVLFRAR